MRAEPRRCRLCGASYLREQSEIRTIVESRDPERFGQALKDLCERHLDQIGRTLGIAPGSRPEAMR